MLLGSSFWLYRPPGRVPDNRWRTLALERTGWRERREKKCFLHYPVPSSHSSSLQCPRGKMKRKLRKTFLHYEQKCTVTFCSNFEKRRHFLNLVFTCKGKERACLTFLSDQNLLGYLNLILIWQEGYQSMFPRTSCLATWNIYNMP